MQSRIIDRYEGSLPGPLLICLGGIHGNEPAGLEAIEEVFRLLDIETKVNPEFRYHGTVVGIRGNLHAIEKKQRFIQRDLNRMLLDEEVQRIQNSKADTLIVEDLECMELLNVINEVINKYTPPLTLILDLHTTTADGGIFTIAGDDAMSRSLALGLHTPVILGFEEDLKGTTLQYFNRPDQKQYCIVFEAGQHDDPESVHRAAAAIVNCMRTIGAVHSRDVDHRHDGLLIRLSEGLPKVTRLVYHYRIKPGENFVMYDGYKNFQSVKAGEKVGKNQHGAIEVPVSGLMLMPKYQPQGDDGFFIVEVIE